MVKRQRHNVSYSVREEEQSKGYQSFVNPSPKFDKVFTVKYPERPHIFPQPFSFEEREKNKVTQKPAAEKVSNTGCGFIFILYLIIFLSFRLMFVCT